MEGSDSFCAPAALCALDTFLVEKEPTSTCVTSGDITVNFMLAFHTSSPNTDLALQAKCGVGRNRVGEKQGRNQGVWCCSLLRVCLGAKYLNIKVFKYYDI
jgi:hypothetical protein